MDTIEKLQSQKKMLEISFEQTNNSRNDLIKQLGEQELLNETLQNEIKCLKVKADDWSEMNKEALKFRKLWEEKLQEIKQLKEAIEEHVKNLNFVSTQNEKNKEIIKRLNELIEANIQAKIEFLSEGKNCEAIVLDQVIKELKKVLKVKK